MPLMNKRRDQLDDAAEEGAQHRVARDQRADAGPDGDANDD